MACETREIDLGGIGRALAILRRAGPFGRWALLPDGPLWQPGTTADDRAWGFALLTENLHRLGLVGHVINSASPADADRLAPLGYLPVVTGGYHARLDLGGGPTARRGRMQGKWRNRLVRAEALGIGVEHGRFCPDRHRWLLAAEARQRRERRYRGLPLAFTETAGRMAPDATRLFVARHGGTLVAAMLVLLHDGAATYHIGHITPAGKAICAHNLLLWQAAEWLAARGFHRLDLGPVETERVAGLARFKLGCGAEARARGPSCLSTRVTAPIGRLSARLNRSGVHGFAAQSDRSCR